jgi:predicted nucleic acid-binding protein
VKRVFDASSIFEIAKQADATPLINGYTLSLTAYELGNILWKHTTLTKRLSTKEAEETRQILNMILQTMNLQPADSINQETLETASKHRLSYYDASYLQAAKNLNAELITQDKRLAKTATTLGIPTHPASNL